MKSYFALILFALQINVFGQQTKDTSGITSINIGNDDILHWTARNDRNETPLL
jgi:hypothetical protein